MDLNNDAVLSEKKSKTRSTQWINISAKIPALGLSIYETPAILVFGEGG